MWKILRIRSKPHCPGSLWCVHPRFVGEGKLLQGRGGQEGGVGRGRHAGELSLSCMGLRGSDLERQMVREWWGWGRGAGQGVLIIGFRALVGQFNRCPSQLDRPSAVCTNSGIILTFTYFGKTGMGEREESVRIYSFSVPMPTAKCHTRMNRDEHATSPLSQSVAAV